ncbi:hypothetical protein BRN03_03190 [Xanthomonas oryzae pv. oryzae]|nr:hypothetical protein ATY43_20985 [Xanthomonas oryzae pv. oryzae]AWK20793.1 hypothetical protein B9W05_21960 [Xanthomonas oryzae pv. oryzae]AXI16412.1 hypothetical protein CDO19_03415 [Xanthomonas oryzae pv. oryzae]AXI20373.1 hypothetical protein CDO11_03415 [Xanthomonas oryzae pv. oryzae]AXM23751.1 hypothetical protein BRM77_03360 [Xanthomonas oryzae pv. oryzae]
MVSAGWAGTAVFRQEIMAYGTMNRCASEAMQPARHAHARCVPQAAGSRQQAAGSRQAMIHR